MSNRFTRIRFERFKTPTPSAPDPIIPEKDSARFWTAVSSIAACGATLFAGWAAWETRASALEAARATRAAVWMQTLSEYATPEMLAAMKELRAWQQTHPKDFAIQFEALLSNLTDSPEDREVADRLDSDRRRISSFFGKVLTLDQMGVISEDEIALTWDISTYKYVKDVLAPIQHAKTDSMRRAGLLTQSQEADSDREQDVMIGFYERVAAAHARRASTIDTVTTP
jgi:hypothetical protein